MAETGLRSVMSETDISSIKETLQSQQQLMQKLYTELDKEREASATAASEALSMILRLQGEKAAVQMEASHYKRLAEEKMSYAENSLSIFEDVIHQKEMEIASLEFQVQAYRCKLLSVGCSDFGAYESRFPENLLLCRSDSCKAEKGANSIIRRLTSLPPMQLKDSYQNKSDLKRERSVSPMSDLTPTTVKQNADGELNDQNLDLERKPGSFGCGAFDSYWEQIRRLDDRVKEISACKVPGEDNSANLKGESMPSSLLPQVSTDIICDQSDREIDTNLEQVKLHKHVQEWEAIVSPSCFSTVQDIFEVPQINENHKAYEHQKTEESKLISKSENRLGKPDVISEDMFRLKVKDETERIKKLLLCAKHDKELSKEEDGASVDCMVLVHPRTGVTESLPEFQQLCQRIERLEGDRNNFRQEISEESEEELKLLKEIHEQLNMVQTELRSWRTKISPPKDEQSLHLLTEVCLSFLFWILLFFCTLIVANISIELQIQHNLQVCAGFLISSCFCSL